MIIPAGIQTATAATPALANPSAAAETSHDAASADPAAPPRVYTANTFLVALQAQPVMTDVLRMPRGAQRKAAAWDKLVATATASQQPILETVKQLQAEGLVDRVRQFTSPNMVAVQAATTVARPAVLAKLQALEGVKAIYLGNSGLAVSAINGAIAPEPGDGPSWGLDVVPGSEREVELPSDHASSSVAPLSELEPTWGLTMMGAKEAWAAGATGKGLVFGSIDTGAQWDHEAIKAGYRGYDATTGQVSHDYNWLDTASSNRSQAPIDSHGHGTHTIGTVLGRTATRAFGVAPEARFISVRGLADAGTEGIVEALDWMQAPRRVDGTAPDATRAPDVVGMSFWNGSPHGTLYQDVIRNLQAAGIEVVKSNGNNGPAPESGSSPGQFEEIHSVAAVDSKGDIAKFSSRGPSGLPHGAANNRPPVWKPDVAAPGVDVLSATPGNKYSTMSGTSMAQPHFSGALLAMLSKYPNLDTRSLRSVMSQGVVDAGAAGRDLEFGFGISNLPNALAAAAKTAG